MAPSKRLRIGIAHGNFADLPGWSKGWQENDADYYSAVAQAGYEGVQGGDAQCCRQAKINFLGSGVVPTADVAMEFARRCKDAGAIAASCIAGFGYESNLEMDEIARAIISASEEHDLPIYLETHRASITQDAWRTVGLTDRVPDIRFNGDFSHWFTGQEMSYGDFDQRLKFLAPVFKRTHLLHGRIGDRGCMQVEVTKDGTMVKPFERMWSAVMAAFIKDREGPADLWFCPELLGREYGYARVINGQEETDRWEQAKILLDIAKDCARNTGLLVD